MNKVQIGVGEGWVRFGDRSQFTDLALVVKSLEQRGLQVFVGPSAVYVRTPGDGVFEPAQWQPAYIDVLGTT